MPAKPKKIPPTERPHERFSRFRNAAHADRAEAARLLAADPMLLEARSSGMGETALHWLAIEDQREAVRWLIARGADVNTRNSSGATPLMDCASMGLTEMCRLLLEHGADDRLRDENGQTALSHAAEFSTSSKGSLKRALPVVELLLSRIGPDEDINAWFDPLTASHMVERDGPVAELLAARGLRDPYPDHEKLW